jgi:CubicO group peptidase (beta-lactamase class C family)
MTARVWGLLMILALAVSSTSAQPRDLKTRMDTYLSKLERAGKFSGAVLVAKGHNVILRAGYGLANRETRVPFTPETPHHVASISKMMTAFTVLKLRDQKRLQLEDRICVYVPDCPAQWHDITIKHLIRHTSGIPDYEEKLGLYSEAYLEFMTQQGATEQLIQQARTQALEFKPGSKFHYSNPAYIVLSSIVELVTGVPFNDAVRELMLEPAGLTHSGFAAPKNVSVGYTKNWQRIPALSLEPPAGDAALVSTLDDLFKWSLAMDDPNRLEVFTPGLAGYGYGWFVDSRMKRKRYVHTGELPGYRTVFVKFPKERVTILIFANQDQAPTELMTREFTKMIFGQ